jgi:nucleotide-binding universal stress UspA family protein
MELRTVVVGVDGSPGARSAAAFAAVLARATSADVVAVHALGLLHRRADDTLVASDRHRGEIRRELEHDWCAPLADAGVDHRTELREGAPVVSLLDACTELGADVLVVGRRGAGGFPGLALGSTSAQLAQHAACPVVIVPAEGPDRSSSS